MPEIAIGYTLLLASSARLKQVGPPCVSPDVLLDTLRDLHSSSDQLNPR